MALTLAQVEQAIEDILTKGQAVTTDGDTYTAASLDSLRRLRQELAQQEAPSMMDRAAMARPRR